MAATNLDVALARRRAERRLRAEVDELAAEVALVLRDVLVERGGEARVVPGCRFRAVVVRSQRAAPNERGRQDVLVVDKVDARRAREAHLPARR